MMRKQSNLNEKRCHFVKRHLYQYGKAENMPVVAGHHALFTSQQYFMTFDCLFRPILLGQIGKTTFEQIYVFLCGSVWFSRALTKIVFWKV